MCSQRHLFELDYLIVRVPLMPRTTSTFFFFYESLYVTGR